MCVIGGEMGDDLGERGAAKRNGVEPLKDVVHLASEFLMKNLAAKTRTVS